MYEDRDKHVVKHAYVRSCHCCGRSRISFHARSDARANDVKRCYLPYVPAARCWETAGTVPLLSPNTEQRAGGRSCLQCGAVVVHAMTISECATQAVQFRHKTFPVPVSFSGNGQGSITRSEDDTGLIAVIGLHPHANTALTQVDLTSGW